VKSNFGAKIELLSLPQFVPNVSILLPLAVLDMVPNVSSNLLGCIDLR